MCGKSKIELASIIFRDGRPICFEGGRADMRNEDVVWATLVAILDFISVSFCKSRSSLKEIKFGDSRLIVDMGKYVFLACLVSGKETKKIRRLMKGAMTDIEGRFGMSLKAWDGNLDGLSGCRDTLKELLCS